MGKGSAIESSLLDFFNEVRGVAQQTQIPIANTGNNLENTKMRHSKHTRKMPPWALRFRFWNSDSGLLEFGLWSADFGLGNSGFDFGTLNIGLRNFKHWISGHRKLLFGLRAFNLWTLEFGPLEFGSFNFWSWHPFRTLDFGCHFLG